MKNKILAIAACALISAVSQPVFAATDFEFNRTETRDMKLRQIATMFKEVTGRDSIFKNNPNKSISDLNKARRQAVRQRLLSRLETISDRRQARRAAFIERYAESWWGGNLVNADVGDEFAELNETLPWEQPNYAGEEMPQVPLPASVWLFMSGLSYLGWKSRKRRLAKS